MPENEWTPDPPEDHPLIKALSRPPGGPEERAVTLTGQERSNRRHRDAPPDGAIRDVTRRPLWRCIQTTCSAYSP